MSNIKQVSLPSGEYVIVGENLSPISKANISGKCKNDFAISLHLESGVHCKYLLPSGYTYSNPIIVSQATEEQAAEIVGKYSQIAVDSLKRICQQELPDYQDWVIIKQEKTI